MYKISTQIQKAYGWIKGHIKTLTLERNPLMNYQEVAVRAAKTFAQAFVAQLVLSTADLLHAPNFSVVQKVLLAAAVAGASAAWNLALLPAFVSLKGRVQ